jgi:hypothetical protein
MKVELVMRIRGGDFMGKTLSRDDIAFEILPSVGDGVIWNGGWAVETCVSRYIGPDYAQVNLSPCGSGDVAELIAAGWVLR